MRFSEKATQYVLLMLQGLLSHVYKKQLVLFSLAGTAMFTLPHADQPSRPALSRRPGKV